ncbi:MAG: erythromycin esterase family protein [Bacteroidota bacterium]
MQTSTSVILSGLFLLLLFTGCEEDETLPIIGEDGLFTDNGLETPEDSNAPVEGQDVISWIEDNHYPVRSLSSINFTDLQFLTPLLENKRIIQLGESGHGVKEYNLAKVRLIKFLHEELGYNVLAFESGMFECYATQQNLVSSTANARNLMNNSIFGVWSTQEVLRLFEYVVATQSTSSPLILTGFDVQFSSFFGSEDRGRFFYDLLVGVDSVYAQEVQELDEDYRRVNFNSYEGTLSFVNTNRDTLLSQYAALADFISEKQDEITNVYQGDPVEVLLGLQLAKSISFHINQHYWASVEDFARSGGVRDEGMARNTAFLLETLYPQEKMMIWAHNFHIRHKNSRISFGGSRSQIVMGEWLHEDYESELYTIGFYAYRGQMANNRREVYGVNSPGRGSLESIMYRSRRKWVFLDLENQTRTVDNAWIYQTTEAKSWGVNRLRMVLDDNYDGIFFIHTVSPPNYLQ